MTMKDKVEGKIKTPPIKVFYYNRALNLQRYFDNLIGNEDRHQNNYLITEDWRILLIDHSRSFRTGRNGRPSCPTGKEQGRPGPQEMPKDLFERRKPSALNKSGPLSATT